MSWELAKCIDIIIKGSKKEMMDLRRENKETNLSTEKREDRAVEFNTITTSKNLSWTLKI